MWLTTGSGNARGCAQVQELDWTVPEQLQNFQKNFDVIIATDCVYHEHLIHDLLRVMLHCADLKTTGVDISFLFCYLPCSEQLRTPKNLLSEFTGLSPCTIAFPVLDVLWPIPFGVGVIRIFSFSFFETVMLKFHGLVDQLGREVVDACHALLGTLVRRVFWGSSKSRYAHQLPLLCTASNEHDVGHTSMMESPPRQCSAIQARLDCSI